MLTVTLIFFIDMLLSHSKILDILNHFKKNCLSYFVESRFLPGGGTNFKRFWWGTENNDALDDDPNVKIKYNFNESYLQMVKILS